ncbi:MAG: AAA family ATPase [Porticoccaceae bacterium]|nr:AAA family ATPase [Porticoccaceae bacterium]
MSSVYGGADFSELNIVNKLGDSLAAEVFLAEDRSSGRAYLVKKIRENLALDGIKEHIEQQLVYLRQQQVPHLTIPELHSNGVSDIYLTQPYPKAQLLRNWLLSQENVDIATFLDIAIGLSDCLIERHQRTLIHKGIKPSNILIEEDPIRIQIVDDVRVLDGMMISQFIQDEQYRRESLPYIAPEQTGRIRMNINYCCDLYAVGAVLYECLSGQALFYADDALDMIHSHLAEEPQALSELNPHCPPVISDIVALLLKKEPEQRYLSAAGLSADLNACRTGLRSELDERGSVVSDVFIAPFALRQHEFSRRINIPSRLIGRDTEQGQLLEAYARVCGGAMGVVSITGLSGIGKTRLIQELEPAIIARRGYYTAGKFNQFAQSLPYSSLAEAFRRLVRQLLTEDIERLKYWREHIQGVVGSSGQLIINYIPELEYIIGAQPPLQPLPPMEERSRFIEVSTTFLISFATAEHPLVLFIDDMQWSDPATFELLNALFEQPEKCPYLLLIFAYRNKEVDAEHGVMVMENTIVNSSLPLLKLHLRALSQHSINQMVALILNTYGSRTSDLSELIYKVSGGNPLFVNESLNWLHKNKRITLSSRGQWGWESGALSDFKLPRSAKALFHEKIKNLPSPIIDILATVALLGAKCQAQDLASIHGLGVNELFSQLNKVFTEKILLHNKGELCFFHDQMQAAADGFLNVETRRQRHDKIARVFMAQLKGDEGSGQEQKPGVLSTRIFTIVEHLDAARVAHPPREVLLEEIKLNYRAGVQAVEALALMAGHDYFRQCLDLCENHLDLEALWRSDYDFMYLLYKAYARAVLMLGETEQSDRIITTTIEHCNNDMDHAECLVARAVGAGTQGQMEAVIDYCNEALRLIDRAMPLEQKEVIAEVKNLRQELHRGGRDIFTEILSAPLITQRAGTLELDIYGELIPAYYVVGENQHGRLVGQRAIALAAQHGVCDSLCFAVAIVSFYYQLEGEYQLSSSYEALMEQLNEHFPNSFGRARATATGLWLLSHNTKSIEEMIERCRQATESSKKSGDIGYAAYTNCGTLYYLFTQGKDLSSYAGELKDSIDFGRRYKLQLSENIGKALYAALLPLLSVSQEGRAELVGKNLLTELRSEEDGMPLALYFVFGSLSAYALGNTALAKKLNNSARQHLPCILNTIVYRLWHALQYLINIEHWQSENHAALLEQVREWAAHGPILGPYLALMEAEKIAQQGDLNTIRIAYQDTIDVSHQQGYTLIEAVANERLGRELKARRHYAGQSYIDSARALYLSCGATANVEQLKGLMALARRSPENRQSVAATTAMVLPEKAVQKSDKQGGEDYDLDNELNYSYLFHVVGAITGELDFNQLLKLIIHSVMNRLGVKTACLLIQKNNELLPAVSGVKKTDIALAFNNEKSFSTENLSMGIAHYCLHSKETVILDNACEEGDFVSDATVSEKNLLSILCIPIIIQQQVLGVIYLENKLIKSAFSRRQIEMTSLLIAQAAIALKNASLLRETKIAADEIKAREHQLRSVLDGMDSFAGLLRPDGGVLFMNKSSMGLGHYSTSDVVGKTFFDFSWWNYSTSVTQQMRSDLETAAQGRRVNRNYQLCLGEGQFIDVDFSLTPIFDSAGEVIFIVPSGIDISAQKRNEEELENLVAARTAELKDKQAQLSHAGRLASLGEMATGIAHELGQPLQIIKLASSIIRDELESDSFEYEEILSVSKDISIEVDKAADIITNMRAYAHFDDSQEAKAIDVSVPLRQCLVFFQQQFQQHSIDLQLEIASDLPMVRANAQKFQQIAVNLLSNARHSVDDREQQGEQHYHKEISVKLYSEASQARLILAVEDNGVGMSEKVRQSCLDPFFTTKEPGRGTGLGLSIISGIMREFHFDMAITSVEGSGATFKVSMPVEGK